MTVRFTAPIYPGGRHCLFCGTVIVGAAFPPPVSGDDWAWRLWVKCRPCQCGRGEGGRND